MILELQNVRKYFPIKTEVFKRTLDTVKAVNGIDLTIFRGETLSLVGESGCGKTTLARLIVKLLPIDAGRIIFDGKDLTDLSGRKLCTIRQQIQMVFQDPFNSLDPRFTIKRVMLEAMVFDKKINLQQKEKRICELFEMVGLPENIFNRFPHEFSGGERQRIAIARALATNPKFLILDEAVSSLDVLIQDQILDLMKDLQNKLGLTYLFISHNLRVVRKISTRIAVMLQGKIIELAETQELLNNPIHAYTKELLLAAMEYKVSDQTQNHFLNDHSKLTHIANGHHVIR